MIDAGLRSFNIHSKQSYLVHWRAAAQLLAPTPSESLVHHEQYSTTSTYRIRSNTLGSGKLQVPKVTPLAATHHLPQPEMQLGMQRGWAFPSEWVWTHQVFQTRLHQHVQHPKEQFYVAAEGGRGTSSLLALLQVLRSDLVTQHGEYGADARL